jgi:hypothetical protein
MLFTETITFYCENHTEHINTLYEQNADFYNVKACGIYSYHFVYIVACISDYRLSLNY